MTGHILCVGDLNADIVIGVDAALAVGSDTPGRVAMSGGGSAANVASGVAAGGGSARFAGVVGDDLVGRFLVDDLERRGVDTCVVVRAGARTRAVAVVVDGDGERSMVSDLTSPTALRTTDLDEGWFVGVAHLHLTAYTWFAPGGPEVFASLTELARRAGIPFSVDPSSAQMFDSAATVEAAIAAFAGADVLFPNADEAMRLTGATSVDDAAQTLLEVAEVVVVTCGGEGVVAATRDGPERWSAPSVDVIDTVGAGDAFAAGFLTQRVAGGSLATCVEAGQASASVVVSSPGAR